MLDAGYWEFGEGSADFEKVGGFDLGEGCGGFEGVGSGNTELEILE